MSGTHWTIFANGEWCKHGLVEELCAASDVTVACDGALEACLQTNITPDLIIGDFDSVPNRSSTPTSNMEARRFMNPLKSETTSKKHWNMQ